VRRALLAGVGVLLAILTGVYLAGRTVVEHRANAALERIRADLPAPARLTIDDMRIALDLRGVRLRGVRLAGPGGTLQSDRIVVRGAVWPFEKRGTRLRRLTASALRGRVDGRVTLGIDRVHLSEVRLGQRGIRETHAGKGRITGVTVTAPGVQLHMPTVYLADVAPPRVDRVYANTSTLHTGWSVDTSVRVAGLSLRDLDLGPLLPVTDRERPTVPVAGQGTVATVSTGRIDVMTREQSRRTVRRLRIGLRRRADGALVGRVRLVGVAGMNGGRGQRRRERLSARFTAIIEPRPRRAALRDLSVDLPGGTRITGRANLDVARAQSTPPVAGVHPTRLRLVDASLDVRGKGGVAAWLGAAPDPSRAAVRGLLARELAALSSFAGVADARARRSAHTLRRFLRDGGRIHVDATPREPIPVDRLRALVQERPMRLIGATAAEIRRP